MSTSLTGGFFYRYLTGSVEVENVLMEHPAVETAVVSSPGPIRGEVMGSGSLGLCRFGKQGRIV